MFDPIILTMLHLIGGLVGLWLAAEILMFLKITQTNLVWAFFRFLAFAPQPKSARWMNPWESFRLFHPRNKGLLIDGKRKRLSHANSFKNCAVIAKT